MRLEEVPQVLTKIEEPEVHMFTCRFLVFRNFVFFPFSQIGLGETQIEVIWMKKIGMMIYDLLNKGEAIVKVVAHTS